MIDTTTHVDVASNEWPDDAFVKLSLASLDELTNFDALIAWLQLGVDIPKKQHTFRRVSKSHTRAWKRRDARIFKKYVLPEVTKAFMESSSGGFSHINKHAPGGRHNKALGRAVQGGGQYSDSDGALCRMSKCPNPDYSWELQSADKRFNDTQSARSDQV